MKTEMSSPEPSLLLGRRQPRSRGVPRAPRTRAWARAVYLPGAHVHSHVPTCPWKDRYTGPHCFPWPLPSPLSPSLPRQPLPAGVIGLIGRQHPVHSGSYLTVTGDVPQTIRPQHEHVVGAVLILCQVIHLYLVGKEGGEGAPEEGR